MAPVTLFSEPVDEYHAISIALREGVRWKFRLLAAQVAAWEPAPCPPKQLTEGASHA